MNDRLAFSDPSATIPAPPGSIGVPERADDTDVRPGFVTPPPGYGQVPFYWWVGDRLTRERLAWQMERLEECQGITGLQINYGHGYQNGGSTFGLSIPSEPPLFSEEWWELTGWFKDEARCRSWSISLSDYTLGPGQGFSFDTLLREHPEMTGAELIPLSCDVDAGPVDWPLPAETLMVAGFAIDAAGNPGRILIDLRAAVCGDNLQWHAPSRHRIMAVGIKRVALSLDPMHPESGRFYADTFFGQFERRFPGEVGKGLNFFFSDELNFNVSGNLWNHAFSTEFRRRKGYDLIPELPALFADCGPHTGKVRLDYRDVMVALSEEGFFKPVFNWHQSRGMIHGCDHGGRGKDVVEFGDYFRAMRWNQGPGCDQPNLGCDLIKNKVASSIAHLYLRPRVWLEGFYSSGWGTSTADLVGATFANFAQGQNLLSLHGLYYSTHGGYWEWAPPCNHFRMPYWPHMKTFLGMVQRLSYVLSQGFHCCDVAILYPVAPMEAGLGGEEAVNAAFDAARALHTRSLDFDFMDFESLDRAQITGRELHVSGEQYRVLVLPAMRAVRWSTLQKALAFQRSGGLVLALGALPEASDRRGADDPELDAAVGELFVSGANVVQTPTELAVAISDAFMPDLSILTPVDEVPDFIHRKIGHREIFFIHGLPQNTEIRLRVTGAVELWDTWTGDSQALPVLEQTNEFTRIRLPLTRDDGHLIVFSPGQPLFETEMPATVKSTQIALDGDWEFELQPTSDNRFGDFHWPPTPERIGAEARRLWYAEGETPADEWQQVMTTFGPQFMRCRELPDPAAATPPADGEHLSFSWRWGIEGDPGFQGYHGLKGKAHDEMFGIGRSRQDDPRKGEWEVCYEAETQDTFLWTSVLAPCAMSANIHAGRIRPVEVWLNGERVAGETVHLKAGGNPLVLRYAKDAPGRTYFVISTSTPVAPPPEHIVYEPGKQPPPGESPMTAKWPGDPGRLLFDLRSGEENPVGWYRFTAPPGLRALRIKAHGDATVWVNEQPVPSAGGDLYRLEEPALTPAAVRIRVDQCRGFYGGAAFAEPIRVECGVGRFPAGDWSANEVLACYSGGAWYRRTIRLPQVSRVVLNLGRVVASAEVRVNGKCAGVKIAPPWTLDISNLVQPGENRIEILVYNTLANHYLTVPTRYRGDLTSGLLGPVTLDATIQSEVGPMEGD